MRPSHDLHPFLLEPKFWRERLQKGNDRPRSLVLVPRPDISSSMVEVEEFRFRSHDGTRLWGLLGRCALNRDCEPACLQLVGGCKPPAIDRPVVEGGVCEFVLQELPGRRLEDRVLDVIQLFRLVRSFQGVDSARVRLHVPETGRAPDELRIADQLQLAGLAR
jgi:hypothetical protein